MGHLGRLRGTGCLLEQDGFDLRNLGLELLDLGLAHFVQNHPSSAISHFSRSVVVLGAVEVRYPDAASVDEDAVGSVPLGIVENHMEKSMEHEMTTRFI